MDSSMEGPVTEDGIARNILRFVRKLDGGESDDTVLKAAIARRWLDAKGAPTPEGRQLIRSFDDLTQGRSPGF